MKFYLKKDLPGIEAGVEVEKVFLCFGGKIGNGHIFQPGEVIEISGSILQEVWKGKESEVWHRIPNSELSDWIEERDGMWKPKMGDEYFVPVLDDLDDVKTKHGRYLWNDSQWGNAMLAHNLVCPTPELAVELADRMIETAKKFWEEKK